MKRYLLFFSFTLMNHSFATNGIYLSSHSAQGMGVAGTGVANLTSIQDASVTNPSLLTRTSSGIDLSLINLLPTVRTKDASQETHYKQSTIRYVAIPSVGMKYEWKNTDLAFSVVPMSGLASNFKNKTSVFELAPSLNTIGLPLTVARKFDQLSIGFSLIPTLGSASINTSKTAGTPSQSERNPNQQLSLGYSLGINYQLTEKSSLGLSYLSKTRFNFRKQTDLESYVGQYGTDLDDLELETPEVLAIGVAHTYQNHTFAFDAKRTFWASARGFKDYDWKNQTTVSASWQYRQERFTTSLGYAFSEQVFSSKTNEDGTKTRYIEGVQLTQQNISYFNAVGYPAVLRHKIGAGLSYKLTDKTHLHHSILYSPQEKIRRSGTGFLGAYDYQTKISLLFINIGMSYLF